MPNNNTVHTAWRTFIETRQEEAGRGIADDPQFSILFNEYQETIDGLVSVLQGGVAVSPVELVDRLEKIRDLNDELMAAVEERFYLAGLKDGVAVGQVFLIQEGEDDYLQHTLDDYLTLAVEIAREYGEGDGEGLKAS